MDDFLAALQRLADLASAAGIPLRPLPSPTGYALFELDEGSYSLFSLN